MEKKTGYRTITYRFRLYTAHVEWLLETKKMYNSLLSFFYDVLLKEPSLWEVPKLQRMRRMEFFTVGTKEMQEEGIKYPLPYEKVPLYFRRAAINDAIRLQESFRATKKNEAGLAGKFNASPIFYKGMYKEFTADSIQLKLYNGADWKWETCRIDTCGYEFPSVEQMLSPVVVLNKDIAMLHVPVKETVEDVRTVKERMPETEKICALYFPKGDVLAVAVILSKEGEFLESHFVRGGDELMHRRNRLLHWIESNRVRMGGDKGKLPPDENKALREKIHRIADDAAHRVSREIVTFCRERNVTIIVVPKYGPNKDYTGSSFAIQQSVQWIGRRIISYIRYKSFGEGIVTATVGMKGILLKCAACGADIKKSGREFQCPNGHKGNIFLNYAVSIGKKFIQLYG